MDNNNEPNPDIFAAVISFSAWPNITSMRNTKAAYEAGIQNSSELIRNLVRDPDIHIPTVNIVVLEQRIQYEGDRLRAAPAAPNASKLVAFHAGAVDMSRRMCREYSDEKLTSTLDVIRDTTEKGAHDQFVRLMYMVKREGKSVREAQRTFKTMFDAGD